MDFTRAPIVIDPRTGLKIFNTRARSAVEGKATTGVNVVADEELTSIPGAEVAHEYGQADKDAYRRFRDERSEGTALVSMEEEFGEYLADAFSVGPVERDALTDDCEIVIVGAGFSALLTWYKLQQAGFTDVRVCERGGDVGGTWYWNRYPGIACDVESYSYLPLLEEMGYFPTMKYASGFEILQYCRSIAERFDFYDHCLFNTSVDDASWSDAEQRWIISTDRGDRMRARFVILCHGAFSTPQLARIEGMDTFDGPWFHSARWRHDVDLAGKRVAVVGTGASAVQLVPELAKIVGELYVFQRTPSTIDVRNQRETTESEIEAWKLEPGWARARRARFDLVADGRTAMLADDDYLAGRVTPQPRKQHAGEISPEELREKQLASNFRLMERIRARVDSVVHDPAVAAALKPYYTYGCKRPTFHDEYLPAFNLPNVHLIDTSPVGVNKVVPEGIVHDGNVYEVDVIVYATGFKFFESSLFGRIRGDDGRSISEAWKAGGTRTLLGIHVGGFPNLFMVGGPQGGPSGFNHTTRAEAHTDHILWVLQTMAERGAATVDVAPEAEEEFARHCRDADVASLHLRDCNSYFNDYGHAEPGSLNYFGGTEWLERAERIRETAQAYIFSS